MSSVPANRAIGNVSSTTHPNSTPIVTRLAPVAGTAYPFPAYRGEPTSLSAFPPVNERVPEDIWQYLAAAVDAYENLTPGARADVNFWLDAHREPEHIRRIAELSRMLDRQRHLPVDDFTPSQLAGLRDRAQAAALELEALEAGERR